ncbi:hypothetical protein [Larsenimonas salina]|uniref:hypothetical protein n=1 Tax=Larsenimonas salina TaxID=1295565 RepID=UPI0020738F24|nr:hypothetical protein [Larsenimonas salina]MCM5705318.1 hypothetical protein [Larsenimonas salina]
MSTQYAELDGQLRRCLNAATDEGAITLCALLIKPLSAIAAHCFPAITSAQTQHIVLDVSWLALKNAQRLNNQTDWHPRHWLALIAVRRLQTEWEARDPDALAHWQACLQEAIEHQRPINLDARRPVHEPDTAHLDCLALCQRLGIAPAAETTDCLEQLLPLDHPVSVLDDALTSRLLAGVAAYRPVRHGDAPMDDPAFTQLSAPSLRWAVRRARWQYVWRERLKSTLGTPLETGLFAQWLNAGPLAGRLEADGLPRRSVENHLGSSLDITLDPRALTRSVAFAKEARAQRRRLANRFIWDGDWDRRTKDLRTIPQFTRIADIWAHRLDLRASSTFMNYHHQLDEGRPFRSSHKGIALDSSDKILAFLDVYRFYLEDMACFGLDAEQGKDTIGVAVNRDGALVKINKGLHRTAMAQVLGIDQARVRVRAVHRQWWSHVVQTEHGHDALQRMSTELPALEPWMT